MSTSIWQVSFYVGTSSDFETRYQTVLASHPPSPACEADVTEAHDMAVARIANHGIVTPFSVIMQGYFDPDANRSSACVIVTQEA